MACASKTTLAVAAGECVVFMAREVLVPVLLGELEELEIILHFALDQLLHGDGLVDMMFGKCV